MRRHIHWCWFLLVAVFQLNAQQSIGCSIDSLTQNTAERELIHQLPQFLKDSTCTTLPHLLLAEESRLFQERGSKTIHRIRAWSYYQLAKDTARHQSIRPFAVADLSNSTNAYVLSAIAKAIVEEGLLLDHPGLSSLLKQAIGHVRLRDKPITFEAYFPSLQGDYSFTNAKEMLGRAMEAISQETPSSCCSIPVMIEQDDQRPLSTEIEVTDQAGTVLRLADYLDRPTVVVFFYTRCENPYKCSATITRLGALERALDDPSIRLAGLTYDPWYDKPDKLRKYGEDRGVQFGEDCRLFTYDVRLSSTIRDYFDLKVSYMSSLVTIHAAEFFVLDGDGRVLYTNDRQDWRLEDVMEVLSTIK